MQAAPTVFLLALSCLAKYGFRKIALGLPSSRSSCPFLIYGRILGGLGMAAVMLRGIRLQPLARSPGWRGITPGVRGYRPKKHPRLQTRLPVTPSLVYSTSSPRKGFGVVGRFLRRQIYLVLLLGGVSTGALLLVSCISCSSS